MANPQKLAIFTSLVMSFLFAGAAPGGSAADEATGRLPEPPPLEQEIHEEAIRDLYSAAYRNKSPSERRTLARRLIEEAETSAGRPARQYVLLREAGDVAGRAGHIDLSLQAVERLAARFTTDRFAVKSEALELLRKAVRNSDARRNLARAYLQFSDEAVIAGRYEFAVGATIEAERLSRKIEDKRLGLAAKAAKESVRNLEGALNTLAEKPEDPKASFVVGSHLCLVRERWKEGLPLLARAPAPEWSRIARGEIQPPLKARERTGIADSWWALSRKLSGFLADKSRERALYWYVQALSKLGGLQRAQLEGRLADKVSVKWSDLLADAVLVLTFDRATLFRKRKDVYFKDLSGRGNHGRLVGDEKGGTVQGRAGDSLICDGQSRCVVLEKLRDHLIGDVKALTISGWLKSEKLSGFRVVFDVGHYAGTSISVTENTGQLSFNLPAGGRVGRSVEPGQGIESTDRVPGLSPWEETEPTWHHFACTWDGREQRFYIDGIFAGRAELADVLLNKKNVGSQRARIGAQAKSDRRRSRYYAGLIDEFALWTRTLSPVEIRSLYLHGCTGQSIKSR